uniref:Receptor kinase-like protein Xa21 n=1 Tax=Zea mays TaxID=4577 RepID=A0A804NTC3_MAIZE
MRNSKPPSKLAMLMALLSLSFLFCYGVEKVHCSTVHENNQDFHSLLDFKKGITNDPNGAMSNWTNNTHFCRWNGVKCTLTPPYRVMELNLTGNDLAGRISTSVGNLTYLSLLALPNNRFSGPIPPLNKLQNLSYLSLDNNFLNGVIPESLTNCSNLDTLGLSKNNLTGVIPPSIGSLTKLKVIFLYKNNLSGVIPSSLGNITNLSVIALSENQLNGLIPTELWQMPHIASLYLFCNNLSGEIPQTISNLSSLQELSLAVNMLSNTLPSNFGHALPNLKLLYLGGNLFEGQIPDSLGNVSGLVHLDMSYNKLTGKIHSIFGKLLGLSFLNLEENMFEASDSASWDFFVDLIACSSLTVLSLASNNLQGAIPNSIANLSTNLRNLLMSDNHLSGVVPPSIGKLNGLIELELDGNNFTGTIEDWMPKLTSLQKLYLHDNSFEVFGKKTSRRPHLSQRSFGEHFEKVTYNDLAKATRDFSEYNLIGRGSYGSVYSGKLKEVEVAVKVFNLEMQGADKSFLVECETLRSIQHRNLLPIITACSSIDTTGNSFKALIYELMPNGNLDKWIHHKDNEALPKRLSLAQRIAVVVNVADALDYLHHDCGRPTIHCDLKPSNILLGDDMNAVLADFGIAHLYSDSQSTWTSSFSSIGVKGSIGYIPPEYGGGGSVSTSGDVYSFGVVCLEILIGKRPIDPVFIGGLDIISFVKNSFPDQIFHIMDSHLVEECEHLIQDNKVTNEEMYQCLVDLLQVALSCTCSLPSERSNMKQVASKLHAIKTSQIGYK